MEIKDYQLDVINGQGVDTTALTVVFFLPDNEFGYGYTYEGEGFQPFKACSLQDRFSEKEMLGSIDELIDQENRTMYVGDFSKPIEALNDVVAFWSNQKKGWFDPSLELAEALQKGKELELDYIIF